MNAMEIEAAALDMQQWDMENKGIVALVLHIVAEVLDNADGS